MVVLRRESADYEYTVNTTRFHLITRSQKKSAVNINLRLPIVSKAAIDLVKIETGFPDLIGQV
jgi:hypothetical protein